MIYLENLLLRLRDIVGGGTAALVMDLVILVVWFACLAGDMVVDFAIRRFFGFGIRSGSSAVGSLCWTESVPGAGEQDRCRFRAVAATVGRT